MTPFNYVSVPLQGNCRWFVRRGDTVKYERGFRSKQDASNWINDFGVRLDWRAGFTLKLKGDSIHDGNRQPPGRIGQGLITEENNMATRVIKTPETDPGHETVGRTFKRGTGISTFATPGKRILGSG